jgi:hypothetical protein
MGPGERLPGKRHPRPARQGRGRSNPVGSPMGQGWIGSWRGEFPGPVGAAWDLFMHRVRACLVPGPSLRSLRMREIGSFRAKIGPDGAGNRVLGPKRARKASPEAFAPGNGADVPGNGAPVPRNGGFVLGNRALVPGYKSLCTRERTVCTGERRLRARERSVGTRVQEPLYSGTKAMYLGTGALYPGTEGGVKRSFGNSLHRPVTL